MIYGFRLRKNNGSPSETGGENASKEGYDSSRIDIDLTDTECRRSDETGP
jgi:hypothetical protein